MGVGLGAVDYSKRDIYPDFPGFLSTTELTQPEESEQIRYASPDGAVADNRRVWSYFGVFVALLLLAVVLGWVK